jgi:hypothetical protein
VTDAQPSVVRSYLEQAAVEPVRMIWIIADDEGSVTEWGGDVELISPSYLELGEHVQAQLLGLTGLLPLGNEPVVVPNFQIEPGILVHLHAFPIPSGAVVLLLDAAPGFEEKRRSQQRTHDDKLAKRRERKKNR